MKKLLILTWLMIVSLMPANVMAGNAADGTVLGAMGGAALGQAIGRDTEGTLIGMALGSILGYAIGSDSERHVYATGRAVAPVYPQHYEQPRYYSQPPMTVIVNKTVVRRPPPVRHVVWEKRHHPRMQREIHRHQYKAHNKKSHRREYARDRGYRYERRERW